MSAAQPNSRGAAFRTGWRARIEAPVARVFARTGLTPNMLTLIGFGIAVIGAMLAATQLWLVAGLVVAFGSAFDMFDGALARATGKSSKLGAFLDSTFDRAGEAVVYVGIAIGLVAGTPTNYSVAVAVGVTSAAMAAAFMVSYARAKSESLGFSPGSGMANVGLAPREVRAVILSLGLVVAGLVSSAGSTWWTVLVGALGLIAILATFTTIQRILFVYRQSQSVQQEVQK